MAEINSSLRGIPANVSRLEAELALLWRSQAGEGEERQALTRSSALTLVVYVETEDAGRQALELIDRVVLQNPCRAVILIAQPEAEPAGLRAYISAKCRLPASGHKEVCCEQVTVEARGNAVAGLDQVVIPLLAAELPVFLWWRGGRFARHRYLEEIIGSADRVLVDSGRFVDAAAELALLHEEVRRHAGKVVFTDLNWARLTPWREMVAQCFDTAEARPYLDSLAEVRLEYEENSPRAAVHRTQSLLLTGWLASRLGWKPAERPTETEGNHRSFFFLTGGRPVRVEHRPRRFEGGGAGFCFALTLKSAGEPVASFSLVRGPDGKTTRTRFELLGRPMIEGAVRLRVFDEVELLNGEIKFAARDRVFEAALEMTARLISSPR